MKKILKTLCLALVALMCFSTLGGCSGSGDGDGESSGNATALSDYRIVFGEGEEYGDEVVYAMTLQSSIKEKYGIELEIGTDYLNSGESYDSESKEILIGHTAYPQSQSAAERVSYLDYLISVDGNKIVLISGRPKALENCVNYFADNYISLKDGVLVLSSTEEYFEKFDNENAETEASLVSLNLRYAHNATQNNQSIREPRIVSFIKSNMPDSIGVQECEKFWKTRLDDALGKLGYVAAQSEEYDGSEWAFKNFIWYNSKTTALVEGGKIWLSATPLVPSKSYGSDFYITAAWAILENKDTGARYVHVNTHLVSNSSMIRIKEVDVLLAKLKTFENKGYDIFITGDFNDEMTTQTYKNMADKFTDARYATDDEIELSYSYNNYSSETEGPDKSKQNWIDYCFFKGENISIDKFDVVEKWNGGYMSDHNALKIHFTLNKKGADT